MCSTKSEFGANGWNGPSFEHTLLLAGLRKALGGMVLDILFCWQEVVVFSFLGRRCLRAMLWHPVTSCIFRQYMSLSCSSCMHIGYHWKSDSFLGSSKSFIFVTAPGTSWDGFQGLVILLLAAIVVYQSFTGRIVVGDIVHVRETSCVQDVVSVWILLVAFHFMVMCCSDDVAEVAGWPLKYIVVAVECRLGRHLLFLDPRMIGLTISCNHTYIYYLSFPRCCAFLCHHPIRWSFSFSINFFVDTASITTPLRNQTGATSHWYYERGHVKFYTRTDPPYKALSRPKKVSSKHRKTYENVNKWIKVSFLLFLSCGLVT